MGASRVKEREEVFRLLFAAEFSPELSAEELLYLRAETEDDAAHRSPYIEQTLLGAIQFGAQALALAEAASQGWKAARMSPGVRALLKLCVYEMLQSADIPVKIAINEAVELAKAYEDEKSAKFLNGILGTIARSETPVEKSAP